MPFQFLGFSLVVVLAIRISLKFEALQGGLPTHWCYNEYGLHYTTVMVFSFRKGLKKLIMSVVAWVWTPFYDEAATLLFRGTVGIRLYHVQNE